VEGLRAVWSYVQKNLFVFTMSMKDGLLNALLSSELYLFLYPLFSWFEPHIVRSTFLSNAHAIQQDQVDQGHRLYMMPVIVCTVRRDIYLQSGFSSVFPDLRRCVTRDPEYTKYLTTSKVLSPKVKLCPTSRIKCCPSLSPWCLSLCRVSKYIQNNCSEISRNVIQCSMLLP
jgi:hypothetical protein